MERFTRPAPNGRVCLWFAGGDLGRKPLLALVTDDENDGILKLAVLGPNWARHVCHSGVRHKDDPKLVERPVLARENGCWDYLPEPGPPVAVKEPIQAKPTKHESFPSVTDEVKNQIASLLNAGKSTTEVAEALTETTGEKWSYQRVNTTLRAIKQSE
ncbi:MAG: hypothetical protein U9Q82_11285 [Chloroflexota bacterium]|nr:hypothetical protein [Chloroflexota bacterium]